MKKIFITIISFTLIFSCQNKEGISTEDLLKSEDVEALKVKREQLQSSADSLHAIVLMLDNRISEIDPEMAKLVKAIEAKKTVYNHYVKLQASVETEQDVNVSPEFGGIMKLLVKEGQFVRRGQLLATISDGGLGDQLNQAKIQVEQAKAQLSQAEIQRDLAKTTFERRQSLWSQKIGSEMEFLQAKTNFETAQKQVFAASQQVSAAQKGVSGVQAQLDKTRLIAPFSGRVEQLITQSGQVVGPGVPILRLVNPSSLKVSALVPESHLANIKVGTKAIINFPALNKTIESKISLVGTSINPGNRTFKVEVSVPNNEDMLKPNLNAELQLNDYTSEEAIVLPESVIKEDADGKYVFAVENSQDGKGIAKKLYIEVGSESNGFVEILSGVNNGQIIITEGPNKLEEGDKVERSK